MSELLADLDAGVAGGRALLERRVVEYWAARRSEEVDAVLDGLAVRAQHRTDAMEALLALTYRLRLARPAIRRVIVDDQDVADAEQQVLLAVARWVSSYQATAHYRSWLFTVSRREALRVIEQRNRSPEAMTLEDATTSEFVNSMSSVLVTRAEVNRAIDSLPDLYRTAVVMRDVEDRPYQEIADRLGLTLNALKARIHRGRELVERALSASLTERVTVIADA